MSIVKFSSHLEWVACPLQSGPAWVVAYCTALPTFKEDLGLKISIKGNDMVVEAMTQALTKDELLEGAKETFANI